MSVVKGKVKEQKVLKLKSNQGGKGSCRYNTLLLSSHISFLCECRVQAALSRSAVRAEQMGSQTTCDPVQVFLAFCGRSRSSDCSEDQTASVNRTRTAGCSAEKYTLNWRSLRKTVKRHLCREMRRVWELQQAKDSNIRLSAGPTHIYTACSSPHVELLSSTSQLLISNKQYMTQSILTELIPDLMHAKESLIMFSLSGCAVMLHFHVCFSCIVSWYLFVDGAVVMQVTFQTWSDQ